MKNIHNTPSNNTPTSFIILIDAHLENIISSLDPQGLINLILDGQAVAIPAKSTGDVETHHGLVTGNDVLDGAGKYVAVVGETRRERGPVVEDVLGLTAGAVQLGLEGVDRVPKLEDLFLLPGKRKVLSLAHFLHRKPTQISGDGGESEVSRGKKE